MLPEYISLQVAESILFVGKALRVLRNPSLTFESQVLASQRGSSKSFNRADGPTAKYAVSPIGGYQGPELLPPAEAESIATMLRDLKVILLSYHLFLKNWLVARTLHLRSDLCDEALQGK